VTGRNASTLNGDVKQLFIVAAITALAALASTTFAADGAPPHSREETKARLEQWCKDNPEKCSAAKAKAEKWREECRADPDKCREELRAKGEQWCKNNPEKCRDLKEKAEQRRAWCKANPEECRAEMQARREQWCKENPERCRELKEKGDQRREQRSKQQG